MPVAVGTTAKATAVVNDANTARAMGSGALPVFATPAMVALMEKAAVNCLEGQLEDGQTSVGTALALSHNAASPLGLTVTATATITAVEGRKITFEVQAEDGTGPIGGGSHIRFVVEAERFMQKATAKKGG